MPYYHLTVSNYLVASLCPLTDTNDKIFLYFNAINSPKPMKVYDNTYRELLRLHIHHSVTLTTRGEETTLSTCKYSVTLPSFELLEKLRLIPEGDAPTLVLAKLKGTL